MKNSRGYSEIMRCADEIIERRDDGETYSEIHRTLVDRGVVSLSIEWFRILAKQLPTLDNLSVSRLFERLPKEQKVVCIPITGEVAA